MTDDPYQAAKRDYETAVALHRQGALDGAERHYLAVRAAYPDHPGVAQGLGSIALSTGRKQSCFIVQTLGFVS